ncbi:unnamed protein product, partial [Symbiodinium sp. KB8]
EGVQSAFAEGIDDTESIETVRGQDLCLTMCSRILPGGLLYLMLSRHCYASQGVKEQVAVTRLMVARSFGGGSPPPLCPMLLPDVSILEMTSLWGSDKFVIKAVRHVAGRLMHMYPPLANRRSGGLPSMSSYHGEHTGTFTYC